MRSIVSGRSRNTGPVVAWMMRWMRTASWPLIEIQKNSQRPPSSSQ